MAVVDGRTWMEHLSLKVRDLLASTPVGRIGVDSAPEVYPVNHRVDGETILFRTDPGGSGGSRVQRGGRSSWRCFSHRSIEGCCNRCRVGQASRPRSPS